MPQEQQYGEQTLSGSTIRWGEVVKGVAIIAGVALVAVVAFHFGGVGSEWLLTQTNNIPILGQAMQLLVGAGEWIIETGAYLADQAWGLIKEGFSALSGMLAQNGVSPLDAKQVETGVKGGQALMAGGAAALAAIPATKAIAGLHVADASTAVKIGHHAAEEADARPRAAWAAKVGASVAYNRSIAEGKNHADAVKIAHQTIADRLKSRNSSYSQQLEADRAAIEASLGEPKRG